MYQYERDEYLVTAKSAVVGGKVFFFGGQTGDRSKVRRFIKKKTEFAFL